MDALDRKIINLLQTGFPLTEAPFLDVAVQLGVEEK
ncbi:MAG: AsnC family protein, partial [Gammaproteobacteria bacterium]|nr:AsnC family protein [Gammaproteobacteria bacterium]